MKSVLGKKISLTKTIPSYFGCKTVPPLGTSYKPMDDDSLIIKMMTDAWMAGDKERAVLLHDNWMVEFTPEMECDLKGFFGDDYEKYFGEEKDNIMQ